MWKVVSGCLVALTGAGVMCASTIRYHRLRQMLRINRYRMTRSRLRKHAIAECLMFVFSGSYIVGVVQALAAEIDFLYMIESVLFITCAVFFYVMVSGQLEAETALQLRKSEILRTFVNAVDRKDAYTRGHSEHVCRLVELFYEYLPDERRAALCLPKLLDAALLHDIGKISIHDDILKKKAALSDDEWEEMRAHPREGKLLLMDTCFIEIADWVLYHHERIDGNGYERLRGTQIPLESRIIAIVDTFSALMTDREYRAARSFPQAVEIMRNVAGTQLDGELLAYFFRIPQYSLLSTFRATAKSPEPL